MHAEKLHSIVKEINLSYEKDGGIQRLGSLIEAVNGRISQPGAAQFDEQISNLTRKLFRTLSNSSMNNFPPTWRRIVRELNLDNLLPENIQAAVEAAFEKRLFDSDTSKAINEIRDQLGAKLKSIALLQNGFQAVGVAEDTLAFQEVEFEVAMPREAISDELSGFSRELNQLNTQLRVLGEITQHGAPPLTINSISTNDFTLAVNINVELAEVILALLTGIALIKGRFQKRREVMETSFSDAPEELKDGFQKWVANYQRTEIANLVDRLPSEFPETINQAEFERLRGKVQDTAEYLADKIEIGFNMDVRAGDPPTDDEINSIADEDARKALQEKRARLLEISKKSAGLKVIEKQISPILSLETNRQMPGETPN